MHAYCLLGNHYHLIIRTPLANAREALQWLNDIWIAALAIQHDLLLLSRDAHFDVLPQIARC